MNLLQKLARKTISLAFRIGIPTVTFFHYRTVLNQEAMKLEDYPEGTLGKDIGDCLQRHGMRPLPYYENHDLKHVLLQFQMTPVDEIRLQAFMIGNGNHSLASIAVFCVGALLLPDEWRTFYSDFRLGKKVQPIRTWTVESHGHCQTASLRELIFKDVVVSQKSQEESTVEPQYHHRQPSHPCYRAASGYLTVQSYRAAA